MHLKSELLSRGIAHSVAVAAIVALSGACSDRGASAPQAPAGRESLEHYLSGTALNQLHGDGTLRIANVPTQGTRPQISETRAREIATAFIATHLRGLRRTLENDRGAPIDVNSVVLCPRVYYAETPLDEVPNDVPDVYHRLYGPWWLTSLCTPGGEPVVALGISAYSTELEISEGKLIYPNVAGGEFRWVGIRPGEDNLLPIPPESAVRRAAGIANRRVASIPRLVLRPLQYPQLAQWHLTLDSEADFRLREGGASARARELFVGAEAYSKPKIRIAVADQPNAVEFEWRPLPVSGDMSKTPPPARSTSVARRAGLPVTFQEIERGGGQ
jgi:hypothetical protein